MTGSFVLGYVITSDVLIGNVFMFAWILVSPRYTGVFSNEAVVGLGIKFPNGTNGANASPVLSKMRDLATSDSDFTKKMVELGVIVL